MYYSKILNQWTQSELMVPSLMKGIENKNLSKNFQNNLELINGKIIGKIGVGTSLLNEFTISSLAWNFITCMNNKKSKVFVVHDDDFYSILFAKIFAMVLVDNGIEAKFNFNNKSLNNATAVWIAKNSREKFDHVVSINSTLSKNIYELYFFDKNGQIFNNKQIEKFNNLQNNTNYLELKINKVEVDTIETDYSRKYIESISLSKKLKNISLSISNPFNYDQDALKKIYDNSVNKNFFVSMKEKTKKINSISRKSIISSINNKTDVIVNFLDSNNNFELFIKHKKRRKYISLNELTILYLDYLVNVKKIDIKNKWIATSVKTSDFINFYANKNGIKVRKYNLFDQQFYDDVDEGLLFATNGNDFFIEGSDIFVSDPIKNSLIFLEILSYYKNQNKTIYEKIMSIYKQNVYYRFSSQKEFLSNEKAKLFFNKIENLTQIDNVQIIRKENLPSKNKIIRLILANKTTIIYEYSFGLEILKSYYSIWSNDDTSNLTNSKADERKREQIFSKLIYREKTIISFVNEFKEDLSIQKITWRTIIKYLIFVVLFIAFFFFIFKFVLDADKQLFQQMGKLLQEEKNFSYLIPILIISAIVCPLVITSWSNVRILKTLKHKTKIKHFMISSFIMICISNITPLVYGGETVGYWYLRRKGLPKSEIAAMFLVQSLLFQISLVLSSAILIPIGLTTLFPELIKNIDSDSIILVVMLIGGIIFNVFAALMIALLTFNQRLQSFIIRNLNKFIEWIPFIVSRDYNANGAKVHYEFSNINRAAKQLFSANPWYKSSSLFIELLGYQILLRILSFGAIIAMVSNLLKNDGSSYTWTYFKMLSADSLVGSINSLNFIIPGGVGVVDWAVVQIMPPLFEDGDVTTNILHFRNVKVYQTLIRIMLTISIVILSSLALFTIYIGESRIDKYSRIKKTLTESEIKNGNIKVHTTFYKRALYTWILLTLILIGIWYLVYSFVLI